VTTLLYLLAAVFCSGFALRAWAGDRHDPVRRAFVVLGSLVGAYYGGFALFLLPGMGMARYLQSGVAAFIPAALLWFLERLLDGAYAPASKAVRRLWIGAPVISVLFLVVDIAFFRDVPRASPTEVVLAVWSYGGLLLCSLKLWREHNAAENRVDKARLRYLLFLCVASFGFALIEDLIRGLGPVPDMAEPGLNQRASELQGVFPPVSTVFTTIFLYFLYQVVRLTRLLDLHEIFSRMLTLGIAALLLVAVDGMAVFLLGGLSANPVHGTFQIFLASVLFLALYDPLRRRIEGLADEWFNRRGRRLELTLVEVDRELARTLSLPGLDQALLGRLQGSGRVPLASLYLRDPASGLFRLVMQKGSPEQPLMRTISGQPFAEGFQKGARAYVRADLLQAVKPQPASAAGDPADPIHEEALARLRTLDAMEADLSIPFRSGDLLLGWLNLKDEAWSDGFSRDEVRRLGATVDRATHVLENIDAVEQLKEQHRLAALGTMAAGLAHEIRNPLAGIKGAAQFLQGGASAAQLQDLLGVVVGETDRLNTVVTQFLDYARPFELHASQADLNLLVARTIDLVRAEDLPGALALELELAPGLPDIVVDADKIRQVVLNLVHNAVQALRDRGTVRIRTAQARMRSRPGRVVDALEISIQDDGPGIAPEDMDKLFIPFFTTRAYGTGLGLPISRRLVEAHGGELLVRSRPGQGSTFLLRLPLAAQVPAPADPPAGSPASAASAASPSPAP